MLSSINSLAWIFVALGGAIGAISRYGVTLLLNKDSFPYGTVVANIAGSFLMGLLAAWILLPSGQGLSDNTKLFLGTGLLGGFTTFSTFSLDSMKLFMNGEIVTASIYILLSVIGALVGIALGYAVVNSFGQTG